MVYMSSTSYVFFGMGLGRGDSNGSPFQGSIHCGSDSVCLYVVFDVRDVYCIFQIVPFMCNPRVEIVLSQPPIFLFSGDY